MKTRKLKRKDKNLSFVLMAILLPLAFASIVILISCSGGGGGGDTSSGTGTGTVTTYITDPPLCKEPNGTLQHVWVTITRVRAHKSSDLGLDDNGWVDLVDLRNNPKQIDLLSLDSGDQCLLLGELGSTSSIPEGKYQQIRLYLLPNDASVGPANDQCDGNGFNCVVDGSGIHTLNLSSQSQTGLKIPPGQIAGGGLIVEAGRVVDLAIDFDACSSIVLQGNGQFRLKPTLRAGEISLVNNIVSGRVVEVVGMTTVPIENAYVFIENDEDGDGIDRVVSQTFTDANGRFAFCNTLFAGTYDVVVAATNGKTYNATVTIGVPLGTDMGDIPLVPEVGGPATIKGMVTTKVGFSTPSPADVVVVALQAVSSSLKVTIPLFGNPTPFVKFTTASAPSSGGTCPNQTDCETYNLVVPASNPQVGTFSVPGYLPHGSAAVKYFVNAQAFAPDTTDPFSGSPSQTTSDITVTADSIIQAPVINFIGP